MSAKGSAVAAALAVLVIGAPTGADAQDVLVELPPETATLVGEMTPSASVEGGAQLSFDPSWGNPVSPAISGVYRPPAVAWVGPRGRVGLTLSVALRSPLRGSQTEAGQRALTLGSSMAGQVGAQGVLEIIDHVGLSARPYLRMSASFSRVDGHGDELSERIIPVHLSAGVLAGLSLHAWFNGFDVSASRVLERFGANDSFVASVQDAPTLAAVSILRVSRLVQLFVRLRPQGGSLPMTHWTAGIALNLVRLHE